MLSVLAEATRNVGVKVGVETPPSSRTTMVRIPTNVTGDSGHRDRSPDLSATGA
uniref:Uncharacterized protein n=1 Tax=Candidatus Kentrum sp. FW TaxID=2126338 RepID=A0A450U3W8_9GAMM|nr:MAG: hypothetical protein BECKFW1821C_GA0114237_11481 [Candidatus Kentron sp. FW]